ncbi:beta strand repeat-containing protein [Vreelandella aquamarina]|uniref:beta strand repeat-containing protein n=1 Tax=Vreelandella aquamarina TaxID=77097 RepID=UPI00384C937E
MAIQGFDKTYYLNAKLAQLQANQETRAAWENKTVADLEAILQTDYGLTAEQHYKQYGVQESLSPAPYFNTDFYLQNKLEKLQADPATASEWQGKSIADVQKAFSDSGLSPLEHYAAYGREEEISPYVYFDISEYADAKAQQLLDNRPGEYADLAAAREAFLNAWEGDLFQHYIQYGASEGINPSKAFDASAYLEEKLAALQAAGETQYQNIEDVKNAFFDVDLNPLTHFITYGQKEGLKAPAEQPDEDQVDDGGNGGESGGGDRTPTPTPTFTIEVSTANVLTFGGTATGEITVSIGAPNNEVVFTREGESDRLGAADYGNLVAVNAGTAELSAPGSLLSGNTLAITSGQLTLTGVTSSMDFSGLTGTPPTLLNVADGETGVVDITPLSAGLSVTAVDLPAGAVAAMTIAQHDAITLSGGGTYALKDTADHLSPGGTADDAVTLGTDVTVTDAASIAQLTALDAANGDGALNYTTVSGTENELTNNSTYVIDGKNVRVTDEISVSGLDTVKAAIGSGTVTAQNLKDIAASLVDSGGKVSVYVGEGTNVTITDDATITQIKAIDAQNDDGTLSYNLKDSFAKIVESENADLVAGAGTVTLEDYTINNIKVADIQYLLALKDKDNTSRFKLSDLTYSLKDTPANLASSAADDILLNATSVTATEAASVSQAKAIYEDFNMATYDIADYVSNLIKSDTDLVSAITQGRDLTALNTADAADATIIAARDGGAGDLHYNVSDTYANLITGSNASGVNAATDLTVSQSGSVNTTEAETVIALTNSGLTTILWIQANVSEINTFLSQANNKENDKLSYNYYVTDSWSAFDTAINSPNLAFIQGATSDNSVTADSVASNITINGTISAANAETFWKAVYGVFSGIADNAPTVAARTAYHVNELDVTNLDNTVADRGSIKDATTITISDTAEAIYQAQQIGQDNGDIFALMNTRDNHRDHITVTASSGYQKIDGTPGEDDISLGDGNDIANGFDGDDIIKGGSGDDTINGGNDSDILEGGTGWDTITGGAGADTIKGGIDSDADYLYGGSGRDTIYAGDSGADTTSVNSTYANSVTGDGGGDRLYGGENRDKFIYAGTDRSTLIDESGTTQNTRDYIENFTLGDIIDFSGVQDSNVQFFGSGSANASNVDPGTLGLSVRYEKNVQVQSWDGNSIQDATRILVDIADADGQFDDQADMHIILIGANIDVNWSGGDIVFGG